MNVVTLPLGDLAWLPGPEVSNAEAARRCQAQGFDVIELHYPVGAGDDRRCSCRDPECRVGGDKAKSVGKHPLDSSWQSMPKLTAEDVAKRWRLRPNANLGLRMGGVDRFVAIDIDGPEGRTTLAGLEERLGALPRTLASRSGRPDGGEHRIFRVRPEHYLAALRNSVGLFRRGSGLDLRATGGQIVIPVSEHVSGARYAWADRSTVADLPETWYRALAAPRPAKVAAPRRASSVPLVERVKRASAYLARVDGAVSGAGGHVQTFKAAMVLVRGFDLDEGTAFELLASEYNPRCQPAWNEAELRRKVSEAATKGDMPAGALLDDARGYAPPAPQAQPEPQYEDVERAAIQDEPQTPTGGPVQSANDVRFALTDLGNAERLAAAHGDVIRYCPPRRAWLLWDKKRWAWDARGGIVALAKKVVRGIYREASREQDPDRAKQIAKHACSSESAGRINAMIELARSEGRLVVLPEELDADPMLLTVANGTLDLKTGALRSHRRDDLITKLAPVAFDPTATCDLWDRYLKESTGDDSEFTAYLSRAAGYALTGLNDERAMLFVYGPPGTGKSTFLDALSATWGEYAASAAAETWLQQTSTGGNRGDLVALMGARLVVSVEVKKGAKWDEALLRRVTGGDLLKYAAKYEAEVTFRPTFKLVFAANDAPKVRDDDEALWERMRRVPFSRRPERLDRGIKETLTKSAATRSAILAWAVRGCAAWQREGLGTCEAVKASTEAYRKEMDRFAPFAAACLVFEPWDEAVVGKSELRDAYETWCRANGVKYPMSAEEFAERIRSGGGKDARAHGGRHVWRRVRLLKSFEKNGAGDGGRPAEPSVSETFS